jgi:hypothetical protein
MMRRTTLFSAAAVVAAAFVPFFWYVSSKPSGDPLGDKIKSFGFFPVEPPSKLVEVGSLYYVNADASAFTAICYAGQTEIKGLVNESPSPAIKESLQQTGDFAANANASMGRLFQGKLNNSYVQAVQFSLSDIMLDEIALGDNWAIFTNIMHNQTCNDIATQYLKAGGYVCQAQKVLRAKAELKLNINSENKLTTDAKTDAGPAIASSAQEANRVLEQVNQTLADSVTYGVAVNPQCMTPNTAHFARTLPRSGLGRAYNFVLYNIVEPLLPAERDALNVAENVHAEGR